MNERFIDTSAEIGEGCTLGYGVVIEEAVRLGPGCSVGHHTVIHAGTQVGANCRIEDHAVLGRWPGRLQPAPSRCLRPYHRCL